MRKLLCLFLGLLLLSGCRGIGEASPGQRAVAQMLAIDAVSEEIQVTVRLLAPDGKPDSYQTVSASGETISEAVSTVEKDLGRELFLRDARLILLGRTLCESGIGICRRYLTDGFEIRPRAVMASTEGMAADYLTAEDGKAAPVDEVVSVLQWSPKSSGVGTTVLALDRDMHASGGDAYLPLLRLTSKGTAEISGGLLLKKEKSSRRIGQEEMKGVRLLFLEPKGETLTLEINGAQAVIKLTSCRRKLRAEVTQEVPEFTFHGSYEAELLEWTGAGIPPETGTLERAAEAAIRERLEEAIRLSVFDAKTDLLQLDSALRRDAPGWWEQNRQLWQENRGNCILYLDVRCVVTGAER